jgi:putative transposase
MAEHPKAYRWSSYRAHAHGVADPLLERHPILQGLGRTQIERQAAYRALFRCPLEQDFIGALRAATNGGWALGSERFKQQIAKALKRRVAPLPPGPKPKAAKDKRQMSLL